MIALTVQSMEKLRQEATPEELMEISKAFIETFESSPQYTLEKREACNQKIAMFSVAVYRDPEFDEKAWLSILNKMENCANSSFSLEKLKNTIDFMCEKSKASQGIWGGMSKPITYIADAEKIDGPKKLT